MLSDPSPFGVCFFVYSQHRWPIPALTLKDFSLFVKGLLVLGESQDVGSILGFHGLEGNTATRCPTLSGYPSIRTAGR